jgi:hypothetical protein
LPVAVVVVLAFGDLDEPEVESAVREREALLARDDERAFEAPAEAGQIAEEARAGSRRRC